MEEIRVMGKVRRALNVPLVMVVVGRKIHGEPVKSHRRKRTGADAAAAAIEGRGRFRF